MTSCPGYRDFSRRLLGICILCERQDDKAKSTTTPPAVKDDRGMWDCVELVAPAGWGMVRR